MLVEVPGASAVFRGGFVTYSDAWKAIASGSRRPPRGARAPSPSRWRAAMAEGALDVAGADLAVATTGVAGPGPDDRGVAEGTVFVAVASHLRAGVFALSLRAPVTRRSPCSGAPPWLRSTRSVDSSRRA